MVVDAQRYLGRSLFGWSSTERGVLRDMARLGIAWSLLVPVKPRGYRLEPENRRVAAAVRRHPARFKGFCRVDPWQGRRALDELRRGLVDDGLSGLFLHPWEEQFPATSALVDPLVALAAERGVPVMVAGGHVRYSTAWQLGELAGRHPTVAFLVTSGGQINVSGAALHEAEVLLEEHPNVVMETSGIYREDFIEDMARRFGPGRVAWGSGAPVFDPDFELLRGRWAHLPDAERERLLGGTAADLFGLGGVVS